MGYVIFAHFYRVWDRLHSLSFLDDRLESRSHRLAGPVTHKGWRYAVGCRPSGALDSFALRNPRARALGYYLSSLRDCPYAKHVRYLAPAHRSGNPC